MTLVGSSEIYIFTKHFIWNVFKKCPSSRALKKKYWNFFWVFTHPSALQAFQLDDNCGAVFSSRTAAVFYSVDFSKTTLTCLDIFRFSFQDFLSKSHPNFKVIIQIKFDSDLWVFFRLFLNSWVLNVGFDFWSLFIYRVSRA